MATDKLVEPDWLEARLDDPGVRVIEIDYVATDNYDAGHIPGALGFYWKDLLWDDAIRDFASPAQFAERCGAAGIANDTTVVFYGDMVQFGTYGWWVFTYLGHRDARVLNGGHTRWRNEGRPWTTAVPTVAPATYAPPPGRNEAMRVRRDELVGLLDRVGRPGGVALLDHRSPAEYAGERVNAPGMPDVGAERAGRIPGAVHLPFDALIGEDTRYRPADELRALFAGAGVDGAGEVVSYCRLSHRATLAWFAMVEILGYPNVRSYDGSWTEWGSSVGVPIER